ncbi:hypothetical protein J1614_006408 [Plenodomus biglobosus]|nr:hypothetical protein J1614_006408 [Plenodomus biglobosus]
MKQRTQRAWFCKGDESGKKGFDEDRFEGLGGLRYCDYIGWDGWAGMCNDLDAAATFDGLDAPGQDEQEFIYLQEADSVTFMLCGREYIPWRYLL